MKVAVVCPNLIGDTVMATPTFRALRLGFPDATMLAVVKPSVAPVLDGSPWFEDRILFDPRSKDPANRSRAVIGRLRRERIDLSILFPNSFRSALVARLAGAKRRLGYVRGGRGSLLTDKLDPPRDSSGGFAITPIVEYYAQLGRHLDCPVDSLRLELFTTLEDERAADETIESFGWPPDGPLVTLNTGGAFGPAKNWPVEHFAALARRLADERGARVLILCGPAERENARAIETHSDHPRVRSLASVPPSLGLSKACVKRSDLLVTTDSGPRHFAAAFGVPVITLFGPTHLGWTRTYHPQAWHISIPVPCGPCQKPVCPLGHHHCMRGLDPASVYTAADRLLRPSNSARYRPAIAAESLIAVGSAGR